MKTLLLASLLGVAAAGLALAATGGDHGTRAEAKDRVWPAAARLLERERSADEVAAMPAEKRGAVTRAQATLAASSPVCRETPATFALLAEFFASTVALDGLAIASFEEGSNASDHEAIPEAVRSAFDQRIAIGAKGSELFASLARAAAPLGAAGCGRAATRVGAEPGPAKITAAEAARVFEALSEQAARLTGNWHLVPARAVGLPAETKSELFAASEVLRREVPTRGLAKETLVVLAAGLDRLVALDGTFAKVGEESSKDHSGELPAERAQMKRAFEARTKATAKVAELLRVMERNMTRDLFRVSIPRDGARTATSPRPGRGSAERRGRTPRRAALAEGGSPRTGGFEAPEVR
ncbi:MAG TPA: hypothetical protein VKF62_13115 [Planctomycetota bacterium]|nr:hypothetical protein [Planctomycetota bacterium]